MTLPTDVSTSCNQLKCCLRSFKHSKRHNRAKTKTCHLPGYRSSTCLRIITGITVYHLSCLYFHHDIYCFKGRNLDSLIYQSIILLGHNWQQQVTRLIQSMDMCLINSENIELFFMYKQAVYFYVI